MIFCWARGQFSDCSSKSQSGRKLTESQSDFHGMLYMEALPQLLGTLHEKFPVSPSGAWISLFRPGDTGSSFSIFDGSSRWVLYGSMEGAALRWETSFAGRGKSGLQRARIQGRELRASP
eukprot:gene6671-biopygen2450